MADVDRADDMDDDGDDLGENSDLGEDGDGDNAKADDWQKKEFIARPYDAPETEKKVRELTFANTRPLIKWRVTKPRKEFCLEFQTVEKDAADSTIDLKPHSKTQQGPNKYRKVLEMGLQAGNKMKELSTQTYFERAVNSSSQYEAADFLAQMREAMTQDSKIDVKLERFVDKVAGRIEEALQSNEIINVFQDDFDMLGDKDEGAGTEQTQSVTERVYQESSYSPNKRVTCIKFHPTKLDLVAFSMIKDSDFDQRCEDSCKSFTTQVLIVNFRDSHITQLNYVLETPVEITCIEFHPNNKDIVLGGCVNGQVIIWDLRSPDHRIVSGGKKIEVAKMPDEEQDKTQQAAVKCKHVAMTEIQESHKNFVADIQFIPNNVRVDKRNPTMGKSQHFISVCEDGKIMIWDTRNVDKDELKERERAGKKNAWRPFMPAIQLMRPDGQGEFGLSRILFHPNQTDTRFYAGSDEGELILVDWTVQKAAKPGAAQAETQKKDESMIKKIYDSERNYRPVLALERSPFYENMIMTVHDFHFCLWMIDKDYDTPIYRSAYTFGAYNTCGAFSPTRPGVIFITKTSGIDIWDFADQSNRPSTALSFTSPTTYFKFQQPPANPAEAKGRAQLMAYGDENLGTLYLLEVHSNMRQALDNEKENIEAFWAREMEKCEYVSERRVSMRADFETKQKQEDLRKMKEEQLRDTMESARAEREQAEEDQYQDDLLTMKAKLGLITEEELEAKRKEAKKKNQ